MSARPRPVRCVLVIADLHFGGTTALLPPGFVTAEGQEVKQNGIQQWLWACWLDLHDWIPTVIGRDPCALVFNGDVIEGCHHGTRQVISPDVADHREAAQQALLPRITRYERRFMIRGTEVHTGNIETSLGKALGCEVSGDTGLPVFDRLTLDVGGCRAVFRHHIGTSTRRALSATQLSVQLAEEQVEAANNREPIPRVLCCAHRHVFGAFECDRGVAVVSPPWQGLTRFAHRVVSQSRVKPGAFILDWREGGEKPRVHSRIYDTPPPAAVRL